MGRDFSKPSLGQDVLSTVREQVRSELTDQLAQGLPVAVAFAAGINACVIKDSQSWWWLVGLGQDTAARLASARPGLKLIFATNNTDSETLSDGQPRDDLAILQKPFAFEQLLMSIERLLGLPSRR